jgi:hypothetical protein
VEKDAMIFLWAFTDARSAIELFRAHHTEWEKARDKWKRARSKKMTTRWAHEMNAWENDMCKIEDRFVGVHMLGENAVLEATLHLLTKFYETHKHCIIGQYK